MICVVQSSQMTTCNILFQNRHVQGYGDKGLSEIPGGATLELDVELLSVKTSPFGSRVKLVEG